MDNVSSPSAYADDAARSTTSTKKTRCIAPRSSNVRALGAIRRTLRFHPRSPGATRDAGAERRGWRGSHPFGYDERVATSKTFENGVPPQHGTTSQRKPEA